MRAIDMRKSNDIASFKDTKNPAASQMEQAGCMFQLSY